MINHPHVYEYRTSCDVYLVIYMNTMFVIISEEHTHSTREYVSINNVIFFLHK